VIFENFQANFSDFLAVLLEACKNAKRVRDGIFAEFARVRGAGGLLLRSPLEGIVVTRWRFGAGRERGADTNLGEDKKDKCSANFDVHCLIPETRAWFDDIRGNFSTFHEEFEDVQREFETRGEHSEPRDARTSTMDEQSCACGDLGSDGVAFRHQ
jgi:hypothetical protein